MRTAEPEDLRKAAERPDHRKRPRRVVIRARDTSVCDRCKLPIERGDKITRTRAKYDGWIHYRCTPA